MEKKLEILDRRLKGLREEISEQWQRDLHPELVREERRVTAQVLELENQLLRLG